MTDLEEKLKARYSDVHLCIFFGQRYTSNGRWEVELRTKSGIEVNLSGHTIEEALTRVLRRLEQKEQCQ